MTHRDYIKQSGLSLSEVEHLIDEWIFSVRDRYVLKRHLLDGICYEKTAEEVSLSTRYTKDVAARSMKILKQHTNISL